MLKVKEEWLKTFILDTHPLIIEDYKHFHLILSMLEV